MLICLGDTPHVHLSQAILEVMGGLTNELNGIR